MSNLRLRGGSEQDRLALQNLLAANRMETEIDPAEFWVALVVNDEPVGDQLVADQLAGAIRLEWEGETAFVRPLVVDRRWQKQGIGKALIRKCLEGVPCLMLTARGEAVGFYTRLGFEPVPWEQIPERYRQECAACSEREDCRPVPMKRTS